jgi:spermidine synthase
LGGFLFVYKTFDGILFDSCPLDKEVEFFQFFPFFKEAFRLLKDDGIFTYFSDEPKNISNAHKKLLRSVGFTRINFEISKVNPPKDCIYWKHKTIVAPIIKK